MAEDHSNPPGGSVPPKAADAPKVQPKKETVRISLPPKPPSTATIKLPSMAAAAPPGVAAPPAAPHPKPVGAPPPPKPPAPPSGTTLGGRPALSTAASSAAAAARPSPAAGAPVASRPAPAAASRRVGPLDTGLAIAAGVLGLGAVVSLGLLLTLK